MNYIVGDIVWLTMQMSNGEYKKRPAVIVGTESDVVEFVFIYYITSKHDESKIYHQEFHQPILNREDTGLSCKSYINIGEMYLAGAQYIEDISGRLLGDDYNNLISNIHYSRMR